MNFFLVYPFRLVGISVLALLLAYALKGDEFRSFFVNPHNPYESSPGSSAEVLIIGGSHAGLSAALALVRPQIDVLILDSSAPRNKWKTSTHVVPTWEGRNPDDLRRASQKELQKTGFASFDDTHITTIEKPGVNESMFTARDSHGGEWSGRKLLIAAGVEFVFPLIKGYEENFPDRM
ncbi:putative thioredoxin reductase -like protein [Rosellinia necatrix]|uniref:Putative thioredoxin reductase-like protein n=1 Tax=Rosellinia necatrix TaxID=77044 RepID=A0A1S8A7G5_ROSNE|nr:putative thioredoxin reductase -like protein [Rosellinia necatrix]